jgi:hypothetical protein
MRLALEAALSRAEEGPARIAEPPLRARAPPRRNADRMSAQPEPVEQDRPREAVAGFLAAVSIFASVFALAYKPIRIIPFALVVSFVAVGIGGRHRGLATFALIFAAGCFVAAMIIAIATGHSLY